MAIVDVALPDVAFTMATDRGVFSHGHLDTGTSLLLREAPAAAGHAATLLDLGCGSWGDRADAGAALAGGHCVGGRRQRPGARADGSERRPQRDRRRSAPPRPTTCRTTCDSTTIWSNPPIRIGKQALHELLERWLGAADARTAAAMLVVQKHLGADSLQTLARRAGTSRANGSPAGPDTGCCGSARRPRRQAAGMSDLGTVGSERVPVAVAIAMDREAVVAEPVVPSTSGPAVVGIRGSAIRPRRSVVSFTAAGPDTAAGMRTSMRQRHDRLSGGAGEQSPLATPMDRDTLVVVDHESHVSVQQHLEDVSGSINTPSSVSQRSFDTNGIGSSKGSTARSGNNPCSVIQSWKVCQSTWTLPTVGALSNLEALPRRAGRWP